MKTKYFISLCHSLLLIYVEASESSEDAKQLCETGGSKKNIGVNCYTYWPDGCPVWKGSVGTKTNDGRGGDKVTNFSGDRDGKWGGGGGRWCGGRKGGDTGRWAYGERWAKGWGGMSGKAGHGSAKGGKKKGDCGGKGKNFPRGGRGGGNIRELEPRDYETEDDD